ncbi:MAG: site-2 protease family protein, partial [Candidatus Wildermuthbacteria bacterium]|nr:site-2 protease family protein [Candidatus Wildermuthbacteria bacterium]
VSHGVVAYSLGDSTAKNAGRLTLNPLPHIDPFGSVLLPLLLIVISQVSGGGIILGWAKPVPVDPRNFKDQKWGSLKVSLAGPGSNIALAIAFGLLLRFLPADALPPTFFLFAGVIVYLNLLLAMFNLIPIPPLDGSHVLFSFLGPRAEPLKLFLYQYGFVFLLLLIFFLFPVISSVVQFLFRLIVGIDI